MPKGRPAFDRRAAAMKAMQSAITTRAKAQVDQQRPACIYGICERLGIMVRFNDINMEGMYERGARSRIHLSALRPLGRRVYNCAHELGHHVFGHGSTIDELREDPAEAWQNPNEFSADTFAGFILMPTLGLRRSFAVRGWSPETATAAQLFTVGCEYGVGYGTLVTHLSTSMNAISRDRAKMLQRSTPKSLRADILGTHVPEPLIVADRHTASTTIDAEVSTLLLLPPDTRATGNNLIVERDLEIGRLFRATRPGIAQATACEGSWTTFIRVARQSYVGLAQYRHLEDNPDE